MRLFSSLAKISTSGFFPPMTVVSETGGTEASISSSTPPVAKCGSVGKGRFARNLRVLFVNGVAYEEWESQAASLRISKLFGQYVGRDIRVHYAYLPMTFRDVVGAIRYGKEPTGCDTLVAIIRERLEELGAKGRKESSEKKTNRVSERVLSGTGRLALFLHSGAGAFFKKAMEKLTKEERSKIDVFSFGSAWLFSKKDFHDALNAVACWDPFPLLGRIVSGNWFPDASTPIVQAGKTVQMPLVSHKFFNLPYQGALERIVKTYADELTEIPMKILSNVTPLIEEVTEGKAEAPDNSGGKDSRSVECPN